MNWYKKAKNTKKDSEEFSYDGSIRHLWDNMLRKEMDRSNIGFDLENNDGYDIKTINLDYQYKDYQYRVKARICWAGGDWESPICYFQCQIEERCYLDREKSWGRWSPRYKTVIIPQKNNPNLIKGDGGRMVALDADSSKKDDDSDKQLWDEMSKLVEKRIKYYYSEYQKPESEIDQSFENTGLARDLVDLMTAKK